MAHELATAMGGLSLASLAAQLPFDVLDLIFEHLEGHDLLHQADPFVMHARIVAVRKLVSAISSWWRAYQQRDYGRVRADSVQALADNPEAISRLLLTVKPGGQAMSKWIAAIGSLSDRVPLLAASDELNGPSLALRSVLSAASKLVHQLDPGCTFTAHSISFLHLGIPIRLGARLSPFHDTFPLSTRTLADVIRRCPNLEGLVIEGRFEGETVIEDAAVDEGRKPLRYLKLSSTPLDVLEWLLAITRADLRCLELADRGSRWARPNGIWSADSEAQLQRLKPHIASIRAISLTIPSHHEVHDEPIFSLIAARLRSVMPQVEQLHLRFDFAALSCISKLCAGVKRLTIIEESNTAAYELRVLIELLQYGAVRAGDAGH